MTSVLEEEYGPGPCHGMAPAWDQLVSRGQPHFQCIPKSLKAKIDVQLELAMQTRANGSGRN